MSRRVTDDVLGSQRDLVPAVELYVAAARDRALRAVTQGLDGPQPRAAP